MTDTPVQEIAHECNLAAVGGTRDDYYNKSDLKRRGWTDSLIAKFLRDADASRENPKYRNAAPQQLFQIARVNRAEESDEFKVALDRTFKRRDAANAAAATRRTNNINRVSEVKIQVELMTREVLVRRACDSYNNLHEGEIRSQFIAPATDQDDPKRLDHICVNYLRHHRTNYEVALSKLRGRTGVQQAVHRMRGRVIAAIASTYPYLREACVRQYPNLAALETTEASLKEVAVKSDGTTLDDQAIAVSV